MVYPQLIIHWNIVPVHSTCITSHHQTYSNLDPGIPSTSLHILQVSQHREHPFNTLDSAGGLVGWLSSWYPAIAPWLRFFLDQVTTREWVEGPGVFCPMLVHNLRFLSFQNAGKIYEINQWSWLRLMDINQEVWLIKITKLLQHVMSSFLSGYT